MITIQNSGVTEELGCNHLLHCRPQWSFSQKGQLKGCKTNDTLPSKMEPNLKYLYHYFQSAHILITACLHFAWDYTEDKREASLIWRRIIWWVRLTWWGDGLSVVQNLFHITTSKFNLGLGANSIKKIAFGKRLAWPFPYHHELCHNLNL